MKLVKAIVWSVMCAFVAIIMPVEYWHGLRHSTAIFSSLFTAIVCFDNCLNEWLSYCGFKWELVDKNEA